MIFPGLLSRDPKTRVRLKRQLMGLASYLMFLLPGSLAVRWGWMQYGYSALFGLLAIAMAFNVAFFALIRSGYSRRLRDPTLLVPQILVALVLALAVVHLMQGDVRSLMLMLFVAMFFFGMFGLDTRQFLRLSAVAVGGYAGLMVVEYHDRPLDTPAFHMEVLRLVVLLMITLWISFVGGYFAHLRAKLADKKHALEEALERVKDLSERDELTGARNRRYLMQALEKERARAERFHLPFCVAIIDLDHFKRINDAYGHPVGDEVLRGFCDLVRRQARELDLIARQDVDDAFGRYGGEEFLLVLPHTTLDGAMQCLERMRTATVAHAFETQAGALDLTFSAGVAQYVEGSSVSTLLGSADGALYRAKSEGRDRVAAA
ncbi:GGDEF domain-containing protein [Lysobacter sp. HA35]